MPEIGFMKIDGVDGESNFKGHKNEIDVLEFKHQVAKEVDPLDCSKVRSDRRHGLVEIVKRFDKATPLIAKKLCEGATIGKIEIKWFRQPDGGGSDPQHYFTHTFTDCVLTRLGPHVPNCLDPNTKSFGHMEAITFGYREATWKSETGGTEFTDNVREK